MKNKLLPLLFVLCGYTAYSQVGIGTPLPNASSQLEVVASDKGILIPRIKLTSSTDTATITNGNQNSLLVFNTNNVADVTAGYYYWYDNKWNRIVISNEVAPSTGTVIYNPTTQQFTYVDGSGVTQMVDFTQVVQSSETVTTLDKDPANNGKYIYKSENDTETTIDVVGDVINNASTIVNNPTFTTQLANVIKTDETLTTLTKDAANDGKYLYTSENATGTTIDVVGDVITNASTILNNPAFKTEITNVIKDEETVTTLVNDGGGSYTYNNEAGTAVNIDVVGDVTTNFSTIANNPAVTTIIQEIATKTAGAVTFDSTTNQFSYTDGSGNPQVVDISTIVKANETVTTLDKNPANNGIYVYTSENATGTTIDVVGDVITNASTILNDPSFKTELTNIITANETVTTLVNNGGGSYTYNNEAGTPVDIDVVGDVTTNFSTIANNPAVTTIIQEIATKTAGAVTFDSTTNQFSYTDGSGNPQVVDISTIVKANETVTTLDKNPANNGIYVYTSENATGTTIDVVGDVITNASTILNDPSFKTELTNIITANETVTTLVNNGGGSYTYNNEAGTPVDIDVVGDVTTNFSTIANNPAVTTIIQEIATKTAGAVTFDSTTNQFSYTDVAGNPQLVDISTIVKANETVTTLDKNPANNGIYVYTSENATGTTIDVVGDVITNASTILNDPSFKTELTNVIKTEETVTTLDKDPANDGKYVYTSENATATTIDVVGDVITNASTIVNNSAFKTELTNVVKAEETITTLVNNGAGSYTYNNEAAAAVNIDVVGDVISNASTIVNDPTFKTELTNVVKAEETVTTQAQNLTTGAITYTNEAGTAVTSQVVSADAGNIVKVGADGGGFVDNAVIKANETLTTEAQNLTTGAITYTNEAGTAVTSQVVSADAGNIVKVGADGGGFVDNAVIKANETLTTEAQNLTTGAITYTNEAGTAVTSQVVSADAGNIVKVGADGGGFVDNAVIKANETLTTEAQNLTTGAITYTNEAGTAVTSQVVSADAGNIVKVGADGGGFVDNAVIKANETLTTEAQNLTTGAITYTNEAGTAVTSQVVSADAGNIVKVGADGGGFVDNAVIKANETLTTEAQNLTTGAITYTNEAGTAVTSQVVSADAGNIVKVGADGGSFVDNAVIKANETVTTITPIVTTGNIIANYTNEAGGTPVDIKETITSLTDVVTQVADPFGNIKDLHTLTYVDETNTAFPIDLSILVKGVETLTSLSYDGTTQSLIYKDEEGNSSDFKLTDLVGDAQTLTTLQVNLVTGTLDFTDEHGTVNPIDLSAAVKEPWFSSTTNVGATLNTENIYTQGWVGIGYTTPSTATNEKLRVNGAITTINSYYADYVFEDYFKGFSEIKADYKFKRLSEVEDYIKKNKHLPGITPIGALEKTKEGYSFNMSELSIQLLEKTEEIYLHIIEQNKEIEAKDKEIKELKLASESMNQRLEKLEKLILEKK